MAVSKNNSALYREIREKAEEITDRNGPMLGEAALAKELGYRDKATAVKWAREHDVPGIRVGRFIRFEARPVGPARGVGRGECL